MNANIGVARGEFGPLDGVILHEPDGFLPYGTSFIQKLAIIVDVEPTPARTFDEVRATATMLDRTKARFGIKPKRLAADTAYGTGKFLGWLVDQEIEPHIPVWDKGSRDDGTFSRSDFIFDPEQDQCICPAGKVLKQFRRNYAVARTDSAHDGIRTEHPKRTARPANSSRAAVQTCYLAISSAASTKRPAITPVNLPERCSSSDPGTNGRRSRCCLRISRPPCASSECASEG